jgi:hypothetical protein
VTGSPPTYRMAYFITYAAIVQNGSAKTYQLFRGSIAIFYRKGKSLTSKSNSSVCSEKLNYLGYVLHIAACMTTDK